MDIAHYQSIAKGNKQAKDMGEMKEKMLYF